MSVGLLQPTIPLRLSPRQRQPLSSPLSPVAGKTSKQIDQILLLHALLVLIRLPDWVNGWATSTSSESRTSLD
ncbi:hypothetical protein RRG08_064868 [Elysia crispata]|uniref:Uncharacterized protein n=1 Tax=Elysia crispata TaxID=231223 RepID=A0AAE1AXZ8_9GAST|nr:hypothetical protein RRG08_064868 [Elysia crispata]